MPECRAVAAFWALLLPCLSGPEGVRSPRVVAAVVAVAVVAVAVAVVGARVAAPEVGQGVGQGAGQGAGRRVGERQAVAPLGAVAAPAINRRRTARRRRWPRGRRRR